MLPLQSALLACHKNSLFSDLNRELLLIILSQVDDKLNVNCVRVKSDNVN